MTPQKNSFDILSLPLSAKAIIDKYLNLSLGDKSIQTPYFINENHAKPIINNVLLADIKFTYKKKKTKRRVFIGKGNPEEIEKVTIAYAKKFQFDLQKADTEAIKNFMEKHGIGIDCSGLVTWIFHTITMDKFGKPLWSYIHPESKSIFKQFLFRLRPVENISVKTLCSPRNSIPIKKIEDIQVGDMIITWWNFHVLLITEIGIGENKKPLYFEYINATWWYGKNNGVLKGKVTIINPQGNLLEQTWEDFQEGKNWTREGVKNDGKIVRLKILGLHLPFSI